MLLKYTHIPLPSSHKTLYPSIWPIHRLAIDKLSSCDALFRQQLEDKQSQHKQLLEQAVRNKELEVVAANNKVM